MGLGTKQNQLPLLVSIQSAGLEAFDSGAANWVIDEGVPEIGHSQSLGDHSAGGVEWVSAENQAGLAVLLEGDAVVHTAR